MTTWTHTLASDANYELFGYGGHASAAWTRNYVRKTTSATRTNPACIFRVHRMHLDGVPWQTISPRQLPGLFGSSRNPVAHCVHSTWLFWHAQVSQLALVAPGQVSGSAKNSTKCILKIDKKSSLMHSCPPPSAVFNPSIQEVQTTSPLRTSQALQQGTRVLHSNQTSRWLLERQRRKMSSTHQHNHLGIGLESQCRMDHWVQNWMGKKKVSEMMVRALMMVMEWRLAEMEKAKEKQDLGQESEVYF